MPAAPRRNVLLVYVDQMTYDTLGSSGNRICRTPNLDRLAAGSVVFERAYTSFPVCSPARATLMTGQYCHTHGIENNVYDGCTKDELPEGGNTLGEVLRRGGVNTGYSGKWHLGNRLPRHYGYEGNNVPGHGSGGFKSEDYHAYLARCGLDMGKLAEPFSLAGPGGRPVAACVTGPLESSVPYWLAEDTIDMMEKFAAERRAKGAPFFLTLAFWGPHPPCFTKKEYLDLYRDARLPEWPSFRHPFEGRPNILRYKASQNRTPWERFEAYLHYYYAFTTQIDAQVGRVLDRLDVLGLADETLVMFTADHGAFQGHHNGCWDKGLYLAEETNHIPFIVRPPKAGKQAGTRRGQFASAVDLMPTILDYAGCPVPEGVQGASLRPVLEGDARTPWRDHAVTEFSGISRWIATSRAIRWGDLKFVFNVTDTDELYDLSADPHELHNLIDEPSRRGDAVMMAERLLAWAKETKDDIHVQLKGKYGLGAKPPDPSRPETWPPFELA